MYSVKGVQYQTLVNIPKNIGLGYSRWSDGKIHLVDGEFLFYGSIPYGFQYASRWQGGESPGA